MQESERNLPTIKQLQYFVALAKHGHFGRAAEASFVSQPAFSVAIREFETLLGARLVDRTNRSVTITALGREVATLARLALSDVKSLVREARTESAPLAGRLALGVIPTIAPFLLPQVLPLLRNAHPALQLYLREEMTDEILAHLAAGDLDLGLIALPWDTPGLEVMHLFDDPFLLAARADTRHVDPVDYRYTRLDEQSILLLEDGHCLRNHAISACRLRSTSKVNRFAASSLLTLVEMIDADLGVSFLPKMAARSSLLDGTEVKVYPLKEKSSRGIGLIWRKGSSRGEEFRALGEFIRQNVRD